MAAKAEKNIQLTEVHLFVYFIFQGQILRQNCDLEEVLCSDSTVYHN